MSKIQVRRAKIIDIAAVIEKLFKFYQILRDKGARDIAQNDGILRGGTIIEVGNGFANPNWFCAVATKDQEVLAFMIAVLEFCQPICEYHKCVRIHADYQETDTFVGPKLLTAMWDLIETWAEENGASFFYANIHPGNQPSIRAAKSIGFKHQYTQFFRPVGLKKQEE